MGIKNPDNSKSIDLNGMMFSTRDRDNDKYKIGNCAVSKGAWWHKNCASGRLNSKYLHTDPTKSMTWIPLNWGAGGIVYSQMKIKYT